MFASHNNGVETSIVVKAMFDQYGFLLSVDFCAVLNRMKELSTIRSWPQPMMRTIYESNLTMVDDLEFWEGKKLQSKAKKSMIVDAWNFILAFCAL